MMFISTGILRFSRCSWLRCINSSKYETHRGISTNDRSKHQFETVFSLPTIKYMALINRLKLYHGFGTLLAVPTTGLLELFGAIHDNTFLTVSYIGLTGFAVLSLASMPFRNVIGHLYITQDNKVIKISSIDFWGKRKDRIVDAEDWIPLLNMKPKTFDAIYLSPQLSDGTKYKLLLKFGKVLNSSKLGQVLE